PRLQTDLAAVAVHDVAGNHETQPGSSRPFRGEKRLKELLPVLLRQPRPPVRDRHPRALLLHRQPATNLPSLRGSVARVGEKIDEDLFELPRVADDPDGLAGVRKLEAQAA